VATRKPRWWVYVLRCADNTLYTGVTTDIARRVKQHNAGTASKYTRARGPVELMYHEAAKGHGPALSREAAIKKLPRVEKLKLSELVPVAAPKRRRRSEQSNPSLAKKS